MGVVDPPSTSPVLQNSCLVRLLVACEDKDVLDVIAHEEDTVWNLKIKIFELINVFPAKQSLLYKDIEDPASSAIVLQNDKSIKDYNLKSGTQISVTPRHSSHEPKSTRSVGFLGGLLTTTKKVGAPKLCFAIGRSLRKAVVGAQQSFNIYKVDSRGKQLKSEDEFEIEVIHLKDNTRVNFKYEKTSGNNSTVTFTPLKNGEFKITIRLEGIDISSSPYRGYAIDEQTPKIMELAFNQEWVTEITQLYSLLALRAETVDNIFMVGHEGLLHLMRNGTRQVQIDMTAVFACLLKKDDNKGRLVRDMGTRLLKLLKTDYWASHLEIKCFVARFLVILAISEDNCSKILDEVGTLPFAALARTPNPECSRGCAKVLCLMSCHLGTRLRLMKEAVFTIMHFLMQQEDIVTTYDTFFALANVCHIDEAQMHIKESMLSFIVSKVSSENMHLRMQSLKILSILSSKAEFAQRLVSYGLHTTVVLHAEGFMAGLVFLWETQATRVLYSNDESGQPSTTYCEGMVSMLKDQFKDDIGCAQYSAIILANIHQHNREELGAFIVKGACLRMLRRMSRSADIVTQIEACKILTTLSSPDQPQEVKEALVSGGMVVALLQAVSYEKPVLLGHIMSTLYNLCKFNRNCLEAASPAEVDKLIDVLLHGGPATERSACLILGSMVAIDKYRSKIVTSGGHAFFTHLIELVRVGELDLLPEIEQSELRVIKKIGRGVSGIVWKAEWKGQIVAVKSFNESNIAFNVDEFASEMALMSVLRHEHVMHCLGGSRWAKKLFLVSEYFARGSLFGIPKCKVVRSVFDTRDMLHKRKALLTLDKILHISTGAASGLQYLHSLGLIHRDVKTGNLLIGQDWTVKIGDFGVSRVVAKRMTRAVGTPCYMAPEVLEGQDYTQAADVYSYAYVIWEMVTRETPFKDTPHLEMAKLVTEDKFRPSLPENCPEPLAELVTSCWHPVPSKRPAFSDILIFLENLRSSYTQEELDAVILAGVEDVEEEEKEVSMEPTPDQGEPLEHEKEWEQLCLQYKREKSKLKQKEASTKSKGRSDLNLKHSSSGRREGKTLTQSRETENVTPTPTPPTPIPPIAEILSPEEEFPLGRPRSYSALPLIRIPQAGDPIPVSPAEAPRVSPLARDVPPRHANSPRTQLDVLMEMVRGAQSVAPASNTEVIIDNEKPPRPPRSALPSPRSISMNATPSSPTPPTPPTPPPPPPPSIQEVDEVDADSDSSPKTEDGDPQSAEDRSRSHSISSETDSNELEQQDQFPMQESSPINVPNATGSVSRPPRRNTASIESPPRGSNRTLRHQHVPSPKLYRSNTTGLPQSRTMSHHKSFTTASPPAEEHFTNVVLKPAPRRPADAPWSPSRAGSSSDTDKDRLPSPRGKEKEERDKEKGELKTDTSELISRFEAQMELHRGRSESMLQPEPERNTRSAEGTRSRSKSLSQSTSPVKPEFLTASADSISTTTATTTTQAQPSLHAGESSTAVTRVDSPMPGAAAPPRPDRVDSPMPRPDRVDSPMPVTATRPDRVDSPFSPLFSRPPDRIESPKLIIDGKSSPIVMVPSSRRGSDTSSDSSRSEKENSPRTGVMKLDKPNSPKDSPSIPKGLPKSASDDGIRKKGDAASLRESNDSTREITLPYRIKRDGSTDSLTYSWGSTGALSTESLRSSSSSLSNSASSLRSSSDCPESPKRGPTATDLARFFSNTTRTSNEPAQRSNPEITNGPSVRQLTRKISVDALKEQEQHAKRMKAREDILSRKTSTDSISNSKSKSSDSLTNPNINSPRVTPAKPVVPPRRHSQPKKEKESKDKEKDKVGRSDSSPSLHGTSPPGKEKEKEKDKEKNYKRFFHRG